MASNRRSPSGGGRTAIRETGATVGPPAVITGHKQPRNYPSAPGCLFFFLC
jgi:hypothetical protein